MAEKEAPTTGFVRLAAELRAEHFERDEEIACAILALVSGTSFFMLGEPGIAKSMLIRRLHLRISGAEFFDLDLNGFTSPDDLFGPRSLSAMKEDRWERVTEGSIVTADFAFLDEFFRASRPLQNALLRAANERTFRQGTEVIPMRLTTLFAAANEVPSDPNLAALYDRLLIRRKLTRLRDTGNFISMLELQHDEKPETLLSWADVRAAQEAARRVRLPDNVLLACGSIRTALAAQDILPSDRRFAEAMKVVRAAAWLDDTMVAEPEHLHCLEDILWAHPDQIPVVATVVDTVLEPLISETDELFRGVEQIRRDVRTDLDDIRSKNLAIELHERLGLAERDYKVLRDRAQGQGTSARRQAQLERCRRAINETKLIIRQDLFHVDLDEPRASRGGRGA